MIKTGCEVICMSWNFHEILSVGILKNVIPNLEIKFVDEFTNDDFIIIDSDTDQYSVIEPKKSWQSFTLLDEVSFEFFNQAERFVESMIKKYNKYIEANKDMKGE